MSVKVELGFTASGASAPFFTLGDSTLGVLGNTVGVLAGGEILIDVTQYLISFEIARGKSRELEKHQAGQATVNFNNDERVFDPTFESSPFAGQIEPRRQVRITVDQIVQFEGTIDDWNISYSRGGNSISTAQAFDGFANLANINLDSFTPGEELTGARIESALDNIDWPKDKRSVDDGNATLESQTVEPGTPILNYIQTVSESEPGELFIDKNGNVKFVKRNSGFSSVRPLISDDGNGIDYTSIGVIFGTELLFNEVRVSNSTLTATSINESSVNLYGKRDLDRLTFLSDQNQLNELAQFLSQKFDEPEFRFEEVQINLRTLNETDRDLILELELGDIVDVRFTPNGIPPQIERVARVIGISQTFDPQTEIVRIRLQSTQGALFVLGDSEFGVLGGESVLGF